LVPDLPDLLVPPSGAPRVYARELCGGARDPGTEKSGSGCSLGATHAGGIATDAPGGRRTYGTSNQAASNDARPGGTNAAIAMIAMHSAATARFGPGMSSDHCIKLLSLLCSASFSKSLGKMNRLVLCGALFALSGVVWAQSEAPKGDPGKGRSMFTKIGCYQCHGREAQGSPSTGPRLGPNPLPYPAFVEWVRRPRGEMPPYTSRVLSDADLADIYGFVASRPGPHK
jgi:mono/diheme cytochrome c family protein